MQFPKKRVSDIFKKRDDGPVYLTEEGFKNLQEQLGRLKRALPNLIEEAQRTAAYGDRSDNAEYKQAKGILRRTNWQILDIEEQMKRVVIIKPGLNVSGKVQLGSIVVLEFGRVRKTFQILGPQETDPSKGRISYQSPLGAALMNHVKGDIITIQTGSGSQKYRILEIK